MSLVKLLGAVDGIISIKTHLKCTFGVNEFLSLSFLFMEEIRHDVKKVYGSILSSISSQTLSVSPSNNDLVDLWHNLWCNNYKAIIFLYGNFLVIKICFIFSKNACLLCVLCGNVTAFFYSAPNYTMKNPLWNKQVCPKLINVIMENNPSHRYGAKITLCNIAIKVYPLLSHIFIHTCHFCFAVTWCPSANSMFLSVFYNEPGIKSETCGVIWHVAHESKIQLVNCELSPKSLIEHSSLLDIPTIDAYIFWSLLFSLLSYSLCDSRLPFSLKRTWFSSL